MSEVKRKKGESFEAFIRRVKRQWQQSGRMIQAKKIQFYNPTPSRNVRRKQAVKRARTSAVREYMLKTGQLTEEEERYGKK